MRESEEQKEARRQTNRKVDYWTESDQQTDGQVDRQTEGEKGRVGEEHEKFSDSY